MGTIANSAQINARLDAACKKSGDAALASIGYTPSAAIRALWSKAARRGADLQEVKRLLDGQSESANRSKLEGLEAGRRGVFAYFEREGIPINEDWQEDGSNSISDKDVLTEAMWARLEKRGLS